MRTTVLLGGTLLALVADVAFAANSTSAQRYELHGTGTIINDAPVQDSNRFRLKANLGAQGNGPSVAPEPLTGAGFALSAIASPSSLVCYNDTIFRDDFDGDGF